MASADCLSRQRSTITRSWPLKQQMDPALLFSCNGGAVHHRPFVKDGPFPAYLPLEYVSVERGARIGRPLVPGAGPWVQSKSAEPSAQPSEGALAGCSIGGRPGARGQLGQPINNRATKIPRRARLGHRPGRQPGARHGDDNSDDNAGDTRRMAAEFFP
jgi:hypothetical protein